MLNNVLEQALGPPLNHTKSVWPSDPHLRMCPKKQKSKWTHSPHSGLCSWAQWNRDLELVSPYRKQIIAENQEVVTRWGTFEGLVLRAHREAPHGQKGLGLSQTESMRWDV